MQQNNADVWVRVSSSVYRCVEKSLGLSLSLSLSLSLIGLSVWHPSFATPSLWLAAPWKCMLRSQRKLGESLPVMKFTNKPM